MGYFAKLDENNNVIDVVSVNNDIFNNNDIEIEEIGINFLISLFNHTNWKQTSYNTRRGIHYLPNSNTPSSTQEKALRWNYASIGMYYDDSRNKFLHKKPFESWYLDEQTYMWKSPVPRPNKDFIPIEYKKYNNYFWDENIINWELQKLFNSWILTQDGYYISPIPYPNDDNMYYWNENILNWVLITNNE